MNFSNKINLVAIFLSFLMIKQIKLINFYFISCPTNFILYPTDLILVSTELILVATKLNLYSTDFIFCSTRLILYSYRVNFNLFYKILSYFLFYYIKNFRIIHFLPIVFYILSSVEVIVFPRINPNEIFITYNYPIGI